MAELLPYTFMALLVMQSQAQPEPLGIKELACTNWDMSCQYSLDNILIKPSLLGSASLLYALSYFTTAEY
jgi:hypothetical protein